MSKPNYTGVYHMVSQENFDAYLAALDVNYALRKIVCLLKPSKHIEHDVNTGNMKIKTVTTFKNFDMDFTMGKEFTEDLGPVDGRKCQNTKEDISKKVGNRTAVAPIHFDCTDSKPMQVNGCQLPTFFKISSFVYCGKKKVIQVKNDKRTTVDWEDNKLLCVQRGEKEGRGWTHWLEGNILHLELRAQGVTAKQVFKKAE